MTVTWHLGMCYLLNAVQFAFYCDEKVAATLEGEAAVNINRSNNIFIDKNVICLLVLAVLASVGL